VSTWELPFPEYQPYGSLLAAYSPQEWQAWRELWVSTYRTTYQKYLPVGPSWLSTEGAASHPTSSVLAGSFAWQSTPPGVSWRTMGAMPAWVHEQLVVDITRLAHSAAGTSWSWTPGHEILAVAWEGELSGARVMGKGSDVENAYLKKLSSDPSSIECRLCAIQGTTTPNWVGQWLPVLSEADTWRIWCRRIAVILWHDANMHFPWSNLGATPFEELGHLLKYMPIFGADNEPLVHSAMRPYSKAGLGAADPCAFHCFYPLSSLGYHGILEPNSCADGSNSNFCYMPDVEERNPLATWRSLHSVYYNALQAWEGKSPVDFVKGLASHPYVPYWADLSTALASSQAALQFLATERVLDCVFDGIVSIDGEEKRSWEHGNGGRAYAFYRASKFSSSWLPGYRLMTSFEEYVPNDYYTFDDTSFFLSDHGDPNYKLSSVLRKKIGGCHTAASAAARVLRAFSIVAWKSLNDSGHGFVMIPFIAHPETGGVGWGIPHGDATGLRRSTSRGYRWRSGWRDEVLVSANDMQVSGGNFAKPVSVFYDSSSDVTLSLASEHFGYLWHSKLGAAAIRKLFGGWRDSLERVASSLQGSSVEYSFASTLASIPFSPENTVDGRDCLSSDTITMLCDALELSRPGVRSQIVSGDGALLDWKFGSMLGVPGGLAGDSPFQLDDVLELRSQLLAVMSQWRLDGSYDVESKQFPPPFWFGDEPVDPAEVCDGMIHTILLELDEARTILAEKPGLETVLALMARWVPKGTKGTRQLFLYQPGNPQSSAGFASTAPDVTMKAGVDEQYEAYVCSGIPLLSLPEIAEPRLRLVEVLVRNWTWPSNNPEHAHGGIYLGDLPGTPRHYLSSWQPNLIDSTPYPPMGHWFEDCDGHSVVEDDVTEELMQARQVLTSSQGSPSKAVVVELMRNWLPPSYSSKTTSPNVEVKLTASYVTSSGAFTYRKEVVGILRAPAAKYWQHGGRFCGGVGLFRSNSIVDKLVELQRVLVSNWATPMNWDVIEPMAGTYFGDQKVDTPFNPESIAYPPLVTWFK
jgi:hypothetical protein